HDAGGYGRPGGDDGYGDPGPYRPAPGYAGPPRDGGDRYGDDDDGGGYGDVGDDSGDPGYDGGYVPAGDRDGYAGRAGPGGYPAGTAPPAYRDPGEPPVYTAPAEPLPAEPLPAEPLPAEPAELAPAEPPAPAASALDPAYDAAAEPDPYLAPDNCDTGARTEPFRGPFEPHRGQPRLSDFVPTRSEPDPAEPDRSHQPGRGDASLGATQEKLDKIRDLYLTVEAIGDDNVGKHFDELMTRQRELISDYFRETGFGEGPRDATPTDQPGNG
ncbi:MAG TPA: hypothetical protein VGD68_06310, partial [Streptosporangiaceae bacterium]